MRKEQLLQEILKLSTSDRADLLETVDRAAQEEHDPDMTPVLAAELDRRLVRMQEHPDDYHTPAEVLSRMDSIIREVQLRGSKA